MHTKDLLLKWHTIDFWIIRQAEMFFFFFVSFTCSPCPCEFPPGSLGVLPTLNCKCVHQWPDVTFSLYSHLPPGFPRLDQVKERWACPFKWKSASHRCSLSFDPKLPLVAHECVNERIWWPLMDWCPNQCVCVFLTHSQCSQDKLWI